MMVNTLKINKPFVNTRNIDNCDVSSSKIPDLKKRQLMNSILLQSVYASCGTLIYGYLDFFVPPNIDSNLDGVIAKDKDSNDIVSNQWLENHPYPNRALVQGLKGNPYYLITTDTNQIEKFALNAVCTHLGCVVPWNKAENKFMCPCHGSQYDSEGKVVRGPAPKSLALASTKTNNNKIILSEWEDIDFRTNEKPWWI